MGAGNAICAALLATAVFGFGLASVATLQQDGHSAISVLTLVSIFIVFLLPLLALLLTLGDAPPIDSFAARVSLTYWGRLRHLRALKQYGLTHGYAIDEPTGAPQPLILTGFYDSQHPITVASDASFKLSTRNASAYSLSIKMGSPRDIVSMRISSRAVPKPRVTTIVGQTGARLQRKLYFAVAPEPSLPPPPQFPEQFAQLVEAGRPFLRLPDFVQANPFGIRYTHLSSYGLTVRNAQLDPLLQWMHALNTELEPISPAGNVPSPSGA